MKSQSLFEGINPSKRIKKTIPDTDWSAKALKAQGDLVMSIMVPTMRSADITRISVEGIDRAMIKANHNFALHHIKSAIKDLINRELIGRDGQTYFLTKKAEEAYAR